MPVLGSSWNGHMAHEGAQGTLDCLARHLVRLTGLERKAERVVRVLEWVVAWAERVGRRLRGF